MDFRTWESAEWAAFGGVGALIVYVVIGVIALRQFRESRRLRELEYRPYVIVDFYFKGFSVYLEVRNTGRNPARDVTVSFDKELVSSDDRRAAKFSIFDQPIPMMAPGRTIRIPLGSGPAFFEEGQTAPLSYEVQVTYTDMSGKALRDPPLLLDLAPYRHTVPPRDDAADLVAAVREIRNTHRRWTSNGGLKVISTDHLRAERRRDRTDHWYDVRHAFDQGGVRAVIQAEVQHFRRRFG
ncbi:hypothetical protein RDV89_14235 [Nocardioides zeae]|uniref:Uncharacterized protein n=1 Tax=Nocardioides imazamoxiresistens TaxID=3231893 RepID=A0ABU3PYC1_9ACTN|nr:hypothetical protein [Nocardioides zeae]MDT9594238.1 hypothetical protein [Nocardioides zeae]